MICCIFFAIFVFIVLKRYKKLENSENNKCKIYSIKSRCLLQFVDAVNGLSEIEITFCIVEFDYYEKNFMFRCDTELKCECGTVC